MSRSIIARSSGKNLSAIIAPRLLLDVDVIILAPPPAAVLGDARQSCKVVDKTVEAVVLKVEDGVANTAADNIDVPDVALLLSLLEMGGNGLGQRVLRCAALLRDAIKSVDVLLVVPANIPAPPPSSLELSSHESVDVGDGAG